MKGYVLVSGATQGIGKAAAIALAQRGFTVFSGARDERLLASLAQEAGNGIPASIIPVLLDVTSRESIAAAMARVRERIGPQGYLHALVSNAGVDYNGPLQVLSCDEITSMIEVNLLGAVLLARESLRFMRDGASRLIFVGSAMGLWATPTISVYASTKWGLEGLSDALRVELGMRGIDVCLVEPGVVQTQMTSDAPAILERMLERMDARLRGVYETLMRRIVEMSAAPGSGVSAEFVAATIAAAVESAHPRSRYRVGKDAKAVGLLRHLPDGMRDFVMRKAFGLKRPA